MKILDLAGGTGDIALGIAKDKGFLQPSITVCDLTYDMLLSGRSKALNKAIIDIHWHTANAEQLPYADGTFDRITITFGLRNIANKAKAMGEMARVLKPGGKLYCLEFSPPEGPIKPIYDLYSFKVIPLLGKFFAKDKDAYEYLVESIRQFPKPDIINDMFLENGFTTSSFQKWSGGIVFLHQANR